MAGERYQFGEELGSGGMGKVYRAWDTQEQRWVAAKVLTSLENVSRAEMKKRERVKREMEIALSLRHPSILPATDWGYCEGGNGSLPFLVSPYIEDGALDQLMHEEQPHHRWKLLQIADLIEQAAAGLYYLHEQFPPIIHRDVKPANFLVKWTNEPAHPIHLYLCDFGISRPRYSIEDIASAVLGTSAYMAPEQALAGQLTPASDQYSLAIMACELFSGRLPVGQGLRSNEELRQAQVNQPPVSLSALTRRITSPSVDQVIRRALAKHPGDRFPTVVDFAETLTEELRHQIQRSNSSVHEVRSVRRSAVSSDQYDRVSEPSRDDSSLFSSISIDSAPTDDSVVDEPLPRPQHQPFQRPVPVLRTDSLPATAFQQISLSGRVKQCLWSMDGDLLACVLNGRPPVIVDREGNVHQIPLSGPVQALCWSQQAHVLALSMTNRGTSSSTIVFYSVDSGAMLPLTLSFQVKQVEALAWSSRGQLALWLDNRLLVYMLSSKVLRSDQSPNVQSWEVQQVRTVLAGGLQWSMDGSLLAAGSLCGHLLCWRADSQRLMYPKVQISLQRVSGVAWTPQGTGLALSSGDLKVTVMDASSQRIISRWERLPGMPTHVSISSQSLLAASLFSGSVLVGRLEDDLPLYDLSGYKQGIWSPTRTEMVTLNEKENGLILWSLGR